MVAIISLSDLRQPSIHQALPSPTPQLPFHHARHAYSASQRRSNRFSKAHAELVKEGGAESAGAVVE
jgi:hypothetical protein